MLGCRAPRNEADLEGIRIASLDCMEQGRQQLPFQLTAAQDTALSEVRGAASTIPGAILPAGLEDMNHLAICPGDKCAVDRSFRHMRKRTGCMKQAFFPLWGGGRREATEAWVDPHCKIIMQANIICRSSAALIPRPRSGKSSQGKLFFSCRPLCQVESGSAAVMRWMTMTKPLTHDLC